MGNVQFMTADEQMGMIMGVKFYMKTFNRKLAVECFNYCELRRRGIVS
jgi:hypothetical protein